MRAKAGDFGLEVLPGDGPALAAFIQQETRFWHALIKERKLSAEQYPLSAPSTSIALDATVVGALDVVGSQSGAEDAGWPSDDDVVGFEQPVLQVAGGGAGLGRQLRHEVRI